MLVSDYLQFAVNGEISSLTVSDIGSGDLNSVQSENVKKLIGYLNLASIEIHKKFALIQKEFLIEEVENNKTYDLPTDLMYVSSAAYEDGTQIPLNNENVVNVKDIDVSVSVMFPSQFVAITKGTDIKGRDKISLLYVASPVQASKLTDFLDISHVFTDALLNYIAYKAHAAISGDIEGVNNTYYMRFLASCKSIKMDGLYTVDNLDSNTKLTDRGFV